MIFSLGSVIKQAKAYESKETVRICGDYEILCLIIIKRVNYIGLGSSRLLLMGVYFQGLV